MQKPLIRWTLGEVSDCGFEILLQSIKYWGKIYPQFDRVVCYNASRPDHINELRKNGVELLDQIEEYVNNHEKYYWKPASCGWKLYPPRLRIDAHEIFCDNDLILLERCDIIDEFLNSNDMVFSCSALRRAFGWFARFVPPKLKFNNGMFGVYPLFDLSSKIIEMQKLSGNNRWRNFFDEQGLISAIFIKERFKTIPMNDIYNCLHNFKLAKGVHFCGVNSGSTKSWDLFKKMNIAYL
jgi:hypothetical protein